MVRDFGGWNTRLKPPDNPAFQLDGKHCCLVDFLCMLECYPPPSCSDLFFTAADREESAVYVLVETSTAAGVSTTYLFWSTRMAAGWLCGDSFMYHPPSCPARGRSKIPYPSFGAVELVAISCHALFHPRLGRASSPPPSLRPSLVRAKKCHGVHLTRSGVRAVNDCVDGGCVLLATLYESPNMSQSSCTSTPGCSYMAATPAL